MCLIGWEKIKEREGVPTVGGEALVSGGDFTRD
jgi:hypothetical protein